MLNSGAATAARTDGLDALPRRLMNAEAHLGERLDLWVPKRRVA
jgi:hypothetical protein